MADSADKTKARTVEWVRERLRAEMSSASGALSPQCRDEESILSVVSGRLNVPGADIRACLAGDEPSDELRTNVIAFAWERCLRQMSGLPRHGAMFDCSSVDGYRRVSESFGQVSQAAKALGRAGLLPRGWSPGHGLAKSETGDGQA